MGGNHNQQPRPKKAGESDQDYQLYLSKWYTQANDALAGRGAASDTAQQQRAKPPFQAGNTPRPGEQKGATLPDGTGRRNIGFAESAEDYQKYLDQHSGKAKAKPAASQPKPWYETDTEPDEGFEAVDLYDPANPSKPRQGQRDQDGTLYEQVDIYDPANPTKPGKGRRPIQGQSARDGDATLSTQPVGERETWDPARPANGGGGDAPWDNPGRNRVADDHPDWWGEVQHWDDDEIAQFTAAYNRGDAAGWNAVTEAARSRREGGDEATYTTQPLDDRADLGTLDEEEADDDHWMDGAKRGADRGRSSSRKRGVR